LTSLRRQAHTSGVTRARRHQTLLARLALGLLALVAELAGRSLTHRLNLGQHVRTPSYAHTDYYPFLLAVVKVGVALMLARVAWRFVKARSVAAAAHRLLAAHGGEAACSRPRVRIQLSAKLWLGAFLTTSAIFLVQTDAEQATAGRWPLLGPWLHTSALPVFAVLAVVVAIVYRAVACWLADYETYARESAERAFLVGRGTVRALRPRPRSEIATPRSLFGLAFEVRPPPAPA
jgi:hypothetical protein